MCIRDRVRAVDPERGIELPGWGTNHTPAELQALLHSYRAVSYTHLDVYKRQVMGMDRISQGSISFSEENLDFMIKKLPKDRFVNFSTISIGAKHHVPGMAMTVLKGGGARVGMEDNIYYAPGELLKSNAQMVERAVRIIRELGMEVATPDEAREILKLGR